MKTFEVISNDVVAEAVDVSGTPYCIVYMRSAKAKTDKTTTRIVMLRSKFDAIKSPIKSSAVFKNATLKVPVEYSAPRRMPVLPVAKSELDAVRFAGVNMRSPKEWKIVWGEPLPDDFELVGHAYNDHTYFNLDGTYVNVPVTMSILSRDYDIYEMVEKEKDNSDVVMGNKLYGKVQMIYFIPGNGDQLDVALRLSDQLLIEYNRIRYNSYTSKLFLEKHTVLGKYKRPKGYNEVYVDFDD